jgi:LPXTG-motif cell wall-anchored protein
VKLSLALSTGVVGIAIAATALVAGPAVAAPADADNVYITTTQIGVEGASYPAQWFAGTLGGGKTTDSADSTVSGLAVKGDYQLLNGVPGTHTVDDIVNNSSVVVSAGSAAFQIPIYNIPTAAAGAGNPKQFTTLRPVVGNVPGTSTIDQGQWISSNTITNAAGTVTVAANTPTDYATLLTAIRADAQVLAYGVFLVRTAPAPNATANAVASITYFNLTTWFTPVPTVTLSKSSIGVTALSDSGVTVSATGFLPGESVILFYGNGNSGSDFATVTADANGAVSGLFKPTAGAFPVGSPLTLGASGDSGQNIFAPLSVTADPNVLAATGVDSLDGILAAGALLLAGAALVLIRRRQVIRAR